MSNTGVIDADGVNALVLDTGSNTIANEGLLEATKGATLDIRSVVSNDGGTIKADGGIVDLDASTGNTGTIEAIDGGTVTFNSTAGLLNNSATVEADGGTVNIDTTIENNGGTIEAVDGGIVTIGENVSIGQNFGGILEATGVGSEIEIEGGTTVTIGTIETSDGGLIELQGGNTFLGVTIEDGSFIKNDCGASLTLQDTTTLDGTVTLEGGGTIRCSRRTLTSPAAPAAGRWSTRPRSRAAARSAAAVSFWTTSHAARSTPTAISSSKPAIPSPMPARWKQPTAPRSKSTTASPIPAAQSRHPTPIPWSSSSV